MIRRQNARCAVRSDPVLAFLDSSTSNPTPSNPPFPMRHARPPHFVARSTGRSVSRAASRLAVAVQVMAFAVGSVGTAFASPGAIFSVLPTASAPEPPATGLADAPLEADLLGFSMRVPTGTEVRIERSPTTSYLLSQGGEAPAWRVRIASLTASRAGTTPKSQCEDYIAELRRKEQKFDMLVDEPRRLGSVDAHIIYLGVPLEQGGRGVMGLLVVPTEADSYLVFSILVVDGAFASARALLDQSFATITLRDTMKSRAEAADLLVRGAELLARITPDSLRATIDPSPRVYRMWKPDERGEKRDFGYMVVRIREGMQGEVDASRDAKSLKGEDATPGLLAMVDARIIVNDDPTHTLDAQSRYFMRWDRSSESWSIRSTERQKRASRSSAQTGVRFAPTVGAPRPKLQVITASRDGMTRDPQEWAVPPVYFSQVELIVLGELLPRDAESALIEFRDYAFDQREQKLPQRRETWTRTQTGWRLETQQGAAPAKIVQDFDQRGKRIRRVDIDGSVTELIELEELRALWKSKGLPVE